MGLSWHDVPDMDSLALIVRSSTFPVRMYTVKVEKMRIIKARKVAEVVSFYLDSVLLNEVKR